MDKIFVILGIAASLAACNNAKTALNRSETQTLANKELLRRFYKEVYVNWNMNFADEVLSPNFISHDWPEGSPGGSQVFRAYYEVIRKAVPDAQYEVDDLVAESDRVVVRWRMRGTYKNTFPGIDIPPKGQAVTLKGMAMYRVEKGKLMERWVVSDMFGLLKEVQQTVQK